VTPVVSLDVLPADVPAEYAPAMVDACSSALTEGACAMAAQLPESTAPEAVALVLWQGSELLQVTVRVGRGGGQWVARALNFSANDSMGDRWTTVGLTVATLVGETRQLEAGEVRKPSAVETPGRQPARVPLGSTLAPRNELPRPGMAGARIHHPWRLAAGALAEPGWGDGGWQTGAWLSATFVVKSLPLQGYARGSLALSAGPDVQGQPLSTRWQTVALGAGLYGTWSKFEISGAAALEIGYRAIEAEVVGRQAATHDVPVRLRAAVSVPVSGRFGAVLGSSLRLPLPNERAADAPVLRAAALALEGVVGVEVRL
jgi:hypothetical protein